MSTDRRTVRPRYGRIVALAASVTVCAVSALAGLGVLGPGTATDAAAARPAAYVKKALPAPSTSSTPKARPRHQHTRIPPSGTPTMGPAGVTVVPDHSGSGRRVVFSQRLQRVWLVGAHDAVQRTYLVSGSRTDNLQPGTYAITRRERHAIGIDESGTMEYFDVFTAGPTGAAIGFHSIPVKDGKPLQTRAQLGTPQSHGCIRQATPDAIALWDFAPNGTKVVVVA